VWTCSNGAKSDDFFDWVIFGDESTFHISGTVNKHNVHIWGTENPRPVVEHVRDSRKVKVLPLYPVKRCMDHSFSRKKQCKE
jgi:hypothetical protein